MDLSKATDEELKDEMFLRHPFTEIMCFVDGVTLEQAREKLRQLREEE